MNDQETTDLDDVIIIGGGVNGCGIARDLAGRGVSVRLFEARDLAAGTSSASTKLIHGGLRYLEHFEFALVSEALSEREKLWAIAPHIVWPLRFVLPHLKGSRPGWLIRLGLFLYDHIGSRKLLPASRSINLEKDVAGEPLQDGVSRGSEYSDCWVDDARLVVLNARDAANRGAHIHTRTPVVSFARDADHWRVTVKEQSEEVVYRAKTLVNAAGPGVVGLLKDNDEPTETSSRLVRGSHIVVDKLYDHDKAYFCQNEDGRIFFAIPYEQDFTLIGTTDAEHEGPASEAKASEEELNYLCEATNRYFKHKISKDDIVWTYSGVRPLIQDGSNKPEAATRGYKLELSGSSNEARLLSVFGGKITSFREVGEAACEKLAPLIPHMDRQSWTDQHPLPGGEFAPLETATMSAGFTAEFDFLERSVAERYWRTYGTISRQILSGANSISDLGQAFGHGLYQCEVDHLITNEWAREAEDVLWRRTKLGLKLDSTQQSALAKYIQKRVGI